jgi:DnaJ-class molecular chaperone
VETEFKVEQCELCAGTGRISNRLHSGLPEGRFAPYQCEQCKGTGTVWREYAGSEALEMPQVSGEELARLRSQS